MAHSTAQVTAAPVEIRLAGSAYLLSPLTDLDFGEFENWMQSRVLEIASSRSAGLPPGDREIILREAMKEAARLTMGAPDALPLMVSPEGSTRLVWMGIRRNRPEITLENVRKLLADPQTLADAVEALERLNAVPEDAKKKRVRPAPRTRIKRTTAP
jgi:hypothetical protein